MMASLGWGLHGAVRAGCGLAGLEFGESNCLGRGSAFVVDSGRTFGIAVRGRRSG
jgi:hypothetical protein